MVLRRWESEFSFIKRVDKGRITSAKDLESGRFERWPFVIASRGVSVRSDCGLMLIVIF